MLKIHSCKSENLSVDSPTYDIFELYSSLVTFYHDVHYKQRKIRNYGSGIIFHGNDKSYGNFPDTLQIFQQLFVSSFSTSVILPLRLQISSFSTDLILLQNKTKHCRKAE